MNLFILIMFGAIIGWLVAGRNSVIFHDVILGMVGAIFGGLVMSAFGLPGATGYNVYSFGVALMGAVVIIFLGRSLQDLA